jgi:hypothetical protein
MRVRFVRRRKPESTRALEYVNAPGSDLKLSAEALQREQRQQQRDASMAEYLGGGFPTSRQG